MKGIYRFPKTLALAGAVLTGTFGFGAEVRYKKNDTDADDKKIIIGRLESCLSDHVRSGASWRR